VAISDIDKKELYYLASRGIETQEAKKLIITGFINEILDYLEDTGLANELRNKIDLKVNEVLNRHN
jgi:Fe-S cluster assembly scaffold protein SufB